MKIWPIFVLALLAIISTSFAHGIMVSVRLDNGVPQYSIRDMSLTREGLTDFFMRDAHNNAIIGLALSSEVTTSIIFDLITDIKKAGYETVYIGHSEIAPLDALPTRNITVQIDLNNTSIDEESARRIKRQEFENELKQKAQQAGPAYPPQGVGSADP